MFVTVYLEQIKKDWAELEATNALQFHSELLRNALFRPGTLNDDESMGPPMPLEPELPCPEATEIEQRERDLFAQKEAPVRYWCESRQCWRLRDADQGQKWNVLGRPKCGSNVAPRLVRQAEHQSGKSNCRLRRQESNSKMVKIEHQWTQQIHCKIE